jgi:hypothetical protein
MELLKELVPGCSKVRALPAFSPHLLPSRSFLFIYLFISLPFHFAPPISAQRWKPKPCRIVSCKFRFSYAPSTLVLLLSVVFLLLLRGHLQMVLPPFRSAPCVCTTCARALRSKTLDPSSARSVFLPQSVQKPCGGSFNAMSSKTWRCRIILAPCGRHVHMGVLHAGVGGGTWEGMARLPCG